jgi:hypothetical protein
MRAVRERIDRKLNLLQGRVTRPKGRVQRFALIGGVVIASLLILNRLRHARRERRAAA